MKTASEIKGHLCNNYGIEVPEGAIAAIQLDAKRAGMTLAAHAFAMLRIQPQEEEQ